MRPGNPASVRSMVSPPPPPAPIAEIRAAQPIQGSSLRLAGNAIKSGWLWLGSSRRDPEQLWLPLDTLTSRLGVLRSTTGSGDQLEWYGKKAALNSFQQRSIDDEVALDVGFYYSANAAGRLVGTLLSGLLFLIGDLSAALWGSTVFVAVTWLLTLRLPPIPASSTVNLAEVSGGD